MKFSICISQQTTEKIKVQKKIEIDSAYFDFKEFALYSKTSGFENRYNTIKSCKVEYNSSKKNGEFTIHNNYLTKSFQSTINKLRVKKIDIKFSNIILKIDSLHDTERRCPPFTFTIHKKRSFTWCIGAIVVPWSIPSYYIVNKE